MFIRGFGLNDRYDFIFRDTDVEGSGGTEGGAGGQQTGGESTQGAVDDIEAKIAAAVAAAVEQATAGLKKKNEELIGATKKLKGELEVAKTKPALSDEEYSEFKTLKERMEHDKLLKALAEGKADEVIESVTKKTRMDYEAKLAAEAEEKARIAADAASAKVQLEQFVVTNEITKAAAPVVKPAYTDLVTKLVSERVKMIEGAARVVDSNGDVVTDAAGKPVTVAQHIETLRTQLPDLFVTSTGGGAGGSLKKTPGGSPGRISMEAAENLSMEEFMRLRQEGKIV